MTPSPKSSSTMKLLLLLLMMMAVSLASGFQTGKCEGEAKCQCKWSEGKRMADCSNRGFVKIPQGLTHDIQTLVLDGNYLHHLPKDAFKAAGLLNLQTISLRHCGLTFIDAKAFRDLKIMTHLDLSQNNVTRLNKETFDGSNGLKTLRISHNPLTALGAYQFPPLRSLKTVDLSHCALSYVDKTSFQNLGDSVETILLDNNRLRSLHVESFVPLTSLKSLSLHGNLWICDCELKSFRDWTVDKQLHEPATVCLEPSRLNGKQWAQVEAAEFACKPEIEIPFKYVFGSVGVTAEMACKIKGSPIPRARWVVNGRIVNNNTNPEPFAANSWVIRDADITPDGVTRWYNLTISNPDVEDLGRYLCVAENNGGVMEESVILTFDSPETFTTGIKMSDEQLTIVIAISLAIVILFLFVLCFCCFFVVNNSNKKNSPAAMAGNSKDESMHHAEGSVENQRLLVGGFGDPNSNPTYITNNYHKGEDIDMSVLNQPHPGNYSQEMISYTNLPLSSGGNGDHRPPSSSNSDCFGPVTGVPHHHPHSLSFLNPSDLGRAHYPMESPRSVEQPFNRSGTLPISHMRNKPQNRSISFDHGPRPMPNSQVPIPPQHILNPDGSVFHLPTDPDPHRFSRPAGYVTLPRRPKSSWCLPAADSPHSNISHREPIYDGVGPRTSIDGSSSLSLAKAGSLVDVPSNSVTPRSNVLPSPAFCSPIKELNEHPVSPPLPALLPFQRHNNSQPIAESSSEATLAEENISAYCEPFGKAVSPERSPEMDDPLLGDPSLRRDPYHEAKSKKAPKVKPIPPPKPKKSFDSSEVGANALSPLVTFQDEGAEGSEV